MVWSAAAFGWDPADVLLWVLDLASLAMQAVLRVDLKARHAFRFYDDFIDAGRAVALCRFVELREIMRHGYSWVGEFEMTRLVFFMIRGGDED